MKDKLLVAGELADDEDTRRQNWNTMDVWHQAWRSWLHRWYYTFIINQKHIKTTCKADRIVDVAGKVRLNVTGEKWKLLQTATKTMILFKRGHRKSKKLIGLFIWDLSLQRGYYSLHVVSASSQNKRRFQRLKKVWAANSISRKTNPSCERNTMLYFESGK